MFSSIYYIWQKKFKLYKFLNKTHIFKNKRRFLWKLPKTRLKFFSSLKNVQKTRKKVLNTYINNIHLSIKSINTKNILSQNNPTLKYMSNTNLSQTQNFFYKNLNYTNDIFKYNNLNVILYFFKNPFLLKLHNVFTNNTKQIAMLQNLSQLSTYLDTKFGYSTKGINYSNILPHNKFKYTYVKKFFSSFSNQKLRSNITPWYYHTLIRFLENYTGKKILFQFYPFVNQEISKDSIIRYKKWLPRMSFYERKLGHKFFLEEALHILHIGFKLRDAVFLCTWLKTIILRISFWKTRSIFRFLRYILHNYFLYIFPDLNIKGFKVRLKGKISSAGNSRKKTILYRVGETSHSKIDLRVVNHFQTISTFTGVMGFQLWIFY